MSVILQARGGQERTRYNAYGILPIGFLDHSEPGWKVLKLQTSKIELLDTAGTPEGVSGLPFEWEGAISTYPGFGMSDSPVRITRGNNGSITRAPTRPGEGNFWELRATQAGVTRRFDEEHDAYFSGQIMQRSASRSDLAPDGSVTNRLELLDTLLDEIRYPVFDRGSESVLTQSVTLTGRVAFRDGTRLQGGMPLDQPLISNQFEIDLTWNGAPVIGSYDIMRLDWGMIDAKASLGPIRIVAQPGSHQLSNWLTTYRSRRSAPGELTVHYRNLDGSPAYSYQVKNVVPASVRVVGSGDQAQEVLTLRAGAIRIDPTYANATGGEQAMMNATSAAGLRQFLLQMQGVADSSSWESLKALTGKGGQTLQLRGLMRAMPRGYLSQWLETIRAGNTVSLNTSAQHLDQRGKVLRRDSYGKCSPSRIQLPPLDRNTREALYVEVDLACQAAMLPSKTLPTKTAPTVQRVPTKRIGTPVK